MIVIVGNDVDEEQLPAFSEYKVAPNVAAAKMVLRVVKNPIAVFVQDTMVSEIEATSLIAADIKKQLIRYSTNKDLLKKLSGVMDDTATTNDGEVDTATVTSTEIGGNIIDVAEATQPYDSAADTAQLFNSPTETVQPFKSETNATETVQSFNTATNATETVQPFNSSTGVAETVQPFNSSTGVAEAIQPPAPPQPIEPTPQPTAVSIDLTKDLTKPKTVPTTEQSNTGVAEQEVNDIEDTITEVSDDDMPTFKIPMWTDSSRDAVASKLKAKEEQFNQLVLQMEAKTAEYEKMLKEQDESAEAIVKAYEDKLKEATQAFNKLKGDYAKAMNSAGKYNIYAQKSRGILKEGFAPNEKEAIQSLNLDLRLICTAGEVSDLHLFVKENIETFKEDYVIVDLTGSHFFDMLYQCKANGALRLFSNLTDSERGMLSGNVCHQDNSDIIAEYAFHDITFLDSDWVTFFTNLKEMFPNRKILLLFNSISSFSVLYTISKLATIFRAYVHFRCSVFSIQNVNSRLCLVPKERGIKLIATYYFNEVEDIIKQVGQKYEIKMSTDVMSLSSIEGG